MGITLLKSTLSEFFIFCRLFSAYFARLILPVFSATEFEEAYLKLPKKV